MSEAATNARTRGRQPPKSCGTRLKISLKRPDQSSGVPSNGISFEQTERRDRRQETGNGQHDEHQRLQPLDKDELPVGAETEQAPMHAVDGGQTHGRRVETGDGSDTVPVHLDIATKIVGIHHHRPRHLVQPTH